LLGPLILETATMCGIIGVVRRPSVRTPPTADDIVKLLEQTRAVLPDTVSHGHPQAHDQT
jgi:hypothetical protein